MNTRKYVLDHNFSVFLPKSVLYTVNPYIVSEFLIVKKNPVRLFSTDLNYKTLLMKHSVNRGHSQLVKITNPQTPSLN